jgi:hypothetical protein
MCCHEISAAIPSWKRNKKAKPWFDKECHGARRGILSYTIKLEYLTVKQYSTRADLHVHCRRRAMHNFTKLGSCNIPQPIQQKHGKTTSHSI